MGSSIKQNQNTCFNAGESSKRNKKVSMPTNVVPAPSVPTKSRALANGATDLGTPPVNKTKSKQKNNISETLAAAR